MRNFRNIVVCSGGIYVKRREHNRRAVAILLDGRHCQHFVARVILFKTVDIELYPIALDTEFRYASVFSDQMNGFKTVLIPYRMTAIGNSDSFVA